MAAPMPHCTPNTPAKTTRLNADSARPATSSGGGQDEEELDADGNPMSRGDDDDEDDDGQNLSLAAMEASLKPKVLEMLESIAQGYEELAHMQDNRMSATLNEDNTFSASDELAYQKLRSRIVALVNELHLHNNRIEALVDQIYGINRRIVSIDSGMVKLADAARINRREFIDAYRGAELDPTWVERMMENKGRGWQALFEKARDKVEDLRGDMAMVGQHVGVGDAALGLHPPDHREPLVLRLEAGDLRAEDGGLRIGVGV